MNADSHIIRVLVVAKPFSRADVDTGDGGGGEPDVESVAEYVKAANENRRRYLPVTTRGNRTPPRVFAFMVG